MSEEKNSQGSTAILVIIITIILYVLSIGPVAALHEKYNIFNKDYLVIFYYPVFMLAQSIDIVKELLVKYVELWGVT